MKRIGNLYEKIISKSNIELAFNNAKKGKSHYKEIKIIEENKEIYLNDLRNLLVTNNFKNSEYEVFEKQCGAKKRMIYKLPFFPDRIIHHCIVQILQPIWINIFIRNTYSTIPRRGIHDGVNRIKKALQNKKETKYCLKFDISKFYPSVNNNILKESCAKKIKDENLLKLLYIIIDSTKGIPIGNYISQWFGNLYLAYFDHYCKENLKCKYYYRYCDDVVILSNSKIDLQTKFKIIETYLSENLQLKIKSNWQIYPVDSRGIDFLGYRFFHTHILIRKTILKNFKRKIKNNKATIQTESAYWGWFKHANTFNLTNKYFKKNESRKNKKKQRTAA